MYSQQPYNNKSKYSSTLTIHKQKRYPTKDRHTATLTTILLQQDWRHSQTFPQNPKKKEVATSLNASSTWRPPFESLRRGAPTSSCRASLAPCARQFGRGFWEGRSSCAAISVRTGSGYRRRSAPSDPREDTLVSKKNTRTDNRNPDLSLLETKRPSLTP